MMKIPPINQIKERSKTKRYGYEKFLDFFANYVVKLSIILKITPLQLSLIWIILQFCSTFLFLGASYFYFVIALLIFQIMFIVDLSDGKLFRFDVD